MSRSQPQFPVYIISKGRWESRLTAKCLTKLGTPFKIVVEEQERAAYAEVIDPAKILVLDPAYKTNYDTFGTQYGGDKGTGSGPARNFCWDHSIAAGASHHWIMDDNIRDFFRFHDNRRIRVGDGTILRCMEDFVLRYKNFALAGPNYKMFVPSKRIKRAFTLNTRIYSCILIRNDIPFRWRGRYNEDTDLSLRILKAHWCTILFNTFLQDKMATLTMKGGNTNTIYTGGTLPKSQMLVAMHPDVTRLTVKFKRWHHEVDYSPFAGLKPILRDGVVVPETPDNYGMRLHVKTAGSGASAA